MRRVTSVLVVGLAVLAVSAFAASFHVTDTVLASGSGAVKTCEDDVGLEFHGPGAEPPPPYPPLEYDADVGDWVVGAIAVVTLPDGPRNQPNDCSGLQVAIAVLDADDEVIYRAEATLGNNGNHLFAESQGNPPMALPVGSIENVNVLISDRMEIE